MKLKNAFLAGTFATALVFTACDKNDDDVNTNNDVNTQDETFIVKASQSNQSEVQLGTLAVQNATDSAVKAFAQMMVTEHTAAQADLQGIVDDVNTNIVLSDSLDADQVAMKTTLQSLSGTAFDSAYIAGQVASHEKTLAAFDAELSGGQNAQVKGYANDKRPNIQAHLNMADSLQNVVSE